MFWSLVRLVLLLPICWVSCCSENEKKSLLYFKRSLHDPSGRLKTWNNSTDCCHWKGIQCDIITNHVIQLDLHNPFVNNPAMALQNSTNAVLSTRYLGSLSVDGNKKDVLSPLFDLKMLQVLDLSYNAFIGVAVPQQLTTLKYLRYLSLSNAGFVGMIPRELGNMSALRYLDLSTNYYISSSSITIKDMQMWIGNMRDLEELLLDGVNMTKVASDELGKAISTMHSLRRLQMYNCMLSGPIPPSLANLTRLTHLQLGGNSFFYSIPACLHNLSNLVSLKISSCDLNGSIPSHLLSLPNLQEVDLSANPDLGGELSSILPRHSASLNSLVLTTTSVAGAIPDSIANISSLILLDLSECFVQGTLPSKLMGPKTLMILDLRHNNFQGPLPLPPPSVVALDLSENHFSGSIAAEIVKYKFSYLSLSHNNLSGSIPPTICEPLPMQILDLSNNGLTGEIFPGFVSCSYLVVLNLEKNCLEGELPVGLGKMSSLQTLKVGENRLNGSLPRLANGKQLQILDVGHNSLTGNIASNWILQLLNLKILILRSNRFKGRVPAAISKIQYLQILDLSKNRFTGVIPDTISEMRSMANGSENTKVLEFAWLKDKTYVEKIIIRSKGLELEYVRALSLVKCLDVSDNKLSGHIPQGMGSLIGLIILNISRHHIDGGIPKSLGNMAQLESLDLSQNQLSGVIPSELQLLTFLSYLNLSYNNLTGMIPQGGQFLTFEASSFSHNSGLYGLQVKESWSPSSKDEIWPEKKEVNKIRARERIDSFNVLTGMSFGVGAGIIIAPLLFLKKRREKFFQLLDSILIWFVDLIHCDKLQVAKISDNEDQESSEESKKLIRFCVHCTEIDRDTKSIVHTICIC
ncbi:receptor-like protein 11 [Cryptomeria japonica]|uniref:receptor-like protein 11 n=1 Tax=Cryptomeria japonica TaxID=3369 RepID=UPI0025AB882B|nr:receptor-like protein 11 [Cryptomeria japonica]